MDISTDIIITVVVPVVMAIGAYVVKSIINRIEVLENKTGQHVSDTQVRQLLADKLDPMKSDLSEIKEAIKKLFELYINEKRS